LHIVDRHAVSLCYNLSKEGLAYFVKLCRGSPTSRLCIVPVESTVGSQSVTYDCHKHNIGPSSWPKIECDRTQNNISVLRPNGPNNYVFRFWF
jgi:hypothetical protein